MRDPYVYEGTSILINKLNIKNKELLDLAEADWVSLRIKEIAKNSLKGDYSFSHFLAMHQYFFQDIYEWAGCPRKINIYKEEPILNGMSIEYSDVFDINKDMNAALFFLKRQKWQHYSKEEQCKVFCEAMARIWKIHCFREGNTRTTITFCCQYADEYINKIDRNLLERNSIYVRTALVAYNSFFNDGTDFSKKDYLEKIIYDAMFE